MKTFDKIYEELQSGDNNELNQAWQEAQKEKNKAKKITTAICLTIDIFALIIFICIGTKLTSIFAIIPLLMPILVINLFVFLIVNIIFGKKTNEYTK